MEKRAVNVSRKAIEHIIAMNLASLNAMMEKAAKVLPPEYADRIPNGFIRYLYDKELLKKNMQNKDVGEKSRMRNENKHLFASNEIFWLREKLLAGKFEDSWVKSKDLPELPLIDQDPILLFRCIAILNFLKSHQQILEISKIPGLFKLMPALEGNGSSKTTRRLLRSISVFIQTNRKTIEQFKIGKVKSHILESKSTPDVHTMARRILNPSYKPETYEANSDEEMDVDGKTEDEIVSKRFCSHQLSELSPMEQVRVFELLIERAEVSGPITESMLNSDADLRKLKLKLPGIKKELIAVKNRLKDMPPIILEKEHESDSQDNAVDKKNSERQAVEDKKQALEKEVLDVQKAIDELQSGSRLRASPIGHDRFHRSYWRLPSTPGLIVEQGMMATEPPDENAPLALPPMGTPDYAMSTNELITFLHTLVNGGFPSPKAPVKCFHVNSKELLDELLEKLSPIGVRESNLKQAIKNSRADIEASFN